MPERVETRDGGLLVIGSTTIGPVDRIIVATGLRPDLAMTRELRLDLDPWLESPRALAPMIDPNLHSCGTVPPHGYKALAHPEPGYFAVGIKSYGRAPTFLMATGYEQVRSVAAHLAGDEAAANEVRLVLPETGVCTTDIPGLDLKRKRLLRRPGAGGERCLLRRRRHRQGRGPSRLRLRDDGECRVDSGERRSVLHRLRRPRG